MSSNPEKTNSEQKRDVNPEHDKDIQDYRKHRNKFSNWILILMLFWIFFIVLSGFKYFNKWFELDKYVLIALIGSGTASVSSLLYAVIKGSFSDIWK